jgi:hypothetical protein
VPIRISGSNITCLGLNLQYTNFTTGVYRGQPGVTINDIFTADDDVRAWRGRRLTPFPNKLVFVPAGPKNR